MGTPVPLTPTARLIKMVYIKKLAIEVLLMIVAGVFFLALR
jgi:hypothetical protein